MSSVFFELKAEKTVEGKLQPFDETMIINKLQSIRAQSLSTLMLSRLPRLKLRGHMFHLVQILLPYVFKEF